jgi:hypothetical protein
MCVQQASLLLSTSNACVPNAMNRQEGTHTHAAAVRGTPPKEDRWLESRPDDRQFRLTLLFRSTVPQPSCDGSFQILPDSRIIGCHIPPEPCNSPRTTMRQTDLHVHGGGGGHCGTAPSGRQTKEEHSQIFCGRPKQPTLTRPDSRHCVFSSVAAIRQCRPLYSLTPSADKETFCCEVFQGWG